MPLSCNLGTLTPWNPLGHSRPETGMLYLYFTYLFNIIKLDLIVLMVNRQLFCNLSDKIIFQISVNVNNLNRCISLFIIYFFDTTVYTQIYKSFININDKIFRSL